MGRLLSFALVLTAVAAAIVIAAGGVDVPADKQSATVRAAATPPPADETRGLPVGATVSMHALAFTPASVSVKRGTVVRFRNRDSVEHDVFLQPPGDLSAGPVAQSKRIPPGGRFSVALRGTGVFRFACTLHPTVMQGRIEVRRAA
jgi:plastocyanin